MSLNIGLVRTRWISYDDGKSRIIDEERVYDAGITHNLHEMATKAGIYEAIWRPNEMGKNKAGDIIELLESGLSALKAKPDYYARFNSPNGWGMYENFVPFVQEYLEACKEYPECLIKVSR